MHNQADIVVVVQAYLEQLTKHRIAGPNADLVKSGIISSLTMFDLISFIEKEFKVKVDVLSLDPDNFNSLTKIAKQISVWI